MSTEIAMSLFGSNVPANRNESMDLTGRPPSYQNTEGAAGTTDPPSTDLPPATMTDSYLAEAQKKTNTWSTFLSEKAIGRVIFEYTSPERIELLMEAGERTDLYRRGLETLERDNVAWVRRFKMATMLGLQAISLAYGIKAYTDVSRLKSMPATYFVDG